MAKLGGRTWLVALLLGCWLIPATAVSARQPTAAIVIDANTGDVLHADDADASRYPASLTKMMTIYLVFEQLKAGRLAMSTPITFTRNAAGQPPSQLGLKAGETMTVDHALRALITKSANDVATAVAEHIAGSESAFARLMTAKARELGMRRTVFRNASGLPDSGQVTTARDMATLGLALQDNFPGRYRMFSLSRFQYRSRRYSNHNKLLGRFRGTDGIKTGYTRASGFNIASSVRRDGRHLIGVVIGHRTGRARDARMRTLLTAAFPKASTRRTRPRGTAPLLVAQPRIAPRPVARPATIPEIRPNVAMVRSHPVGTAELARGRVVRQPSTLGQQAMRLQRSSQPQQDSRDGSTTVGRAAAGGASQPVAAAEGTHQVQIGAFHSEADAQRALVIAQSQAGIILRGYQPMSVRVQASPRPVFRARFAGFDAERANETCSRLKTMRFNCFVARAN